ncbi:MAG: DciA family protein [Pseudomonadota bacterium]
MPTQKIGRLLAASSELQALSVKARRLMELQQVYIAAAPGTLAQGSRVKNYRAGTLFLWAGNTAVAAKLRQLAPSLLLKIQKQEPQITGIRVEVQVSEAPRSRDKSREKRSLPVEIIEDFEKLAERVRDPALKSALTRLVRRHSRSG